jgi:hypothetical protein
VLVLNCIEFLCLNAKISKKYVKVCKYSVNFTRRRPCLSPAKLAATYAFLSDCLVYRRFCTRQLDKIMVVSHERRAGPQYTPLMRALYDLYAKRIQFVYNEAISCNYIIFL